MNLSWSILLVCKEFDDEILFTHFTYEWCFAIIYLHIYLTVHLTISILSFILTNKWLYLYIREYIIVAQCVWIWWKTCFHLRTNFIEFNILIYYTHYFVQKSVQICIQERNQCWSSNWLIYDYYYDIWIWSINIKWK